MAWTVISTGSDWTDRLTAVEELRLAFSERHKRVSGGQYHKWDGVDFTSDASNTAVQEDIDIQIRDFFSEIQAWIKTACADYCPAGDLGGSANVDTYGDLATAAGQSAFEYFCKSVVGGNLVNGSDYGFRNSTDGTTYTWSGDVDSTGAGDVIGSWLFADLQACFDAMKHTVETITWSAGDTYYSYGADPDKATAKTDAETNYGASISGADELIRAYLDKPGPDWLASLNGFERSETLLSTDARAEVAASVDLYIRADEPTGHTFDAQGTGWAEGVYTREQAGVTWNDSTNAVLTYGNGATAPPNWPTGVGADNYLGLETTIPLLVVHWNFTN